jgi:hypothetical protein
VQFKLPKAAGQFEGIPNGWMNWGGYGCQQFGELTFLHHQFTNLEKSGSIPISNMGTWESRHVLIIIQIKKKFSYLLLFLIDYGMAVKTDFAQ